MDWSALGWQAWTTLGVVAAVVGLLAFAPIGPDLVVLAGLAVLLVSGVLTPENAFAGFANEGMLTVAALFCQAPPSTFHWAPAVTAPAGDSVTCKAPPVCWTYVPVTVVVWPLLTVTDAAAGAVQPVMAL